MIAAWAFAAMPVMAQDTYEGARLLGNDLNGTARYVGMGGAMEALGADISTISTNPAGIGLFRKSTASLSFGLVSQQDVQKFDGLNKTKMSFDQLGFVYSSRISSGSFINFAFNYHKSKNFNQILSAANRLNGQSLNGLTYRKAEIGNVSGGGYDLDFNKDGELMGWENSTSEYRAQTYSQL
ncbi:MAG: hemin receptor, partial [Prevotella sp.]|nr:hemin receptor [Prevotella sp.]